MEVPTRIGSRALALRYQTDRSADQLLAKAFDLIDRTRSLNQPDHDSEQNCDRGRQLETTLQEAK